MHTVEALLALNYTRGCYEPYTACAERKHPLHTPKALYNVMCCLIIMSLGPRGVREPSNAVISVLLSAASNARPRSTASYMLKKKLPNTQMSALNISTQNIL